MGIDVLARALSSKAKGNVLILEYQKSSAALSLATQLLDGGKCLNTITSVRSLGEGVLGGQRFLVASMRRPPNTPSPSELSKPSNPAANKN